MTKKFILGVILLLAVAVSTTYSQDRKGDHKNMNPSDKATKMADKMKENLNLTDSQYKSVYDIFYNHFTEMNTLRNQYEKGTDEFKSMRKEKREGLKKQLSGVLTSEQLQTMEDNMKKRKEKHKGKKRDKNKTKDRSGTPEKRYLPESK